MAIGTQFPLGMSSLDPKFQFNRSKNNFAKGPKQKAAAQCCRSAKFGDAQAKQGRALATLFLVRIYLKLWIQVSGIYRKPCTNRHFDQRK